MTQYLEQTDFESHLKEIFRVNLGSDRVLELVLEEVSPQKAHSDRYECFSILFSGQREILLDQMTHEITHEQLGTFNLFLVPVAIEDERKYCYEAVFNRKKADLSKNSGDEFGGH